MPSIVSLSPVIYRPILRRALEEDLGRAGDITTDALIPPETRARARILAGKAGCLAGLETALAAFAMVGEGVSIQTHTRDGETVAPGQVLSELEGSARVILTAERTALNLLGHLSGIATTTQMMVRKVAAHPARIVCTRKTTPGLRALEKYAVRAGGGTNHRFGLDDGILIKDNHIAVCGGVAEAVEQARRQAGHMVKIEVEVDTLSQLESLLTVDADAVLLDNMSPATLKQAVAMVGDRMVTEASGGITPDTVAAVAATGVNYISAGFITHSAPNLDVSLDIQVK